jgi:predicted TIM-barrel fold metal-dependent hydrolase
MLASWPNGIIDPHIHQWDPLATERVQSKEARLLRALPRIPRFMGAVASKADREFVGHPHHVLKPYLPETYRRDAGSVPVRKVVHIEAEWLIAERHLDSVGETAWLTGLPFGNDGAPELGAIVVAVDPRWPDVGEVLDAHLAASPLVRGVRSKASHHPDPGVRDFAEGLGLWREPAYLAGFAAIAERGLSFELWCFAHQLPDAALLVREYPETTFVLDHYATPVGIFGPRGRHTARSDAERSAMLEQWREDIAALAEFPNVVAKHSGLGMPILGAMPRRQRGLESVALLVDQWGPLIRHLHDVFGVDRTMWASNFPMDKATVAIPATVAVLLDVLGADANPELLLRDVAARTYRIAV